MEEIELFDGREPLNITPCDESPATLGFPRRVIAAETSGPSRTLIKNSLSNVIAGLSTAVVTLLTPPIFSRTLSSSEFGAWALVLQIAGYTSLLTFGIQAAVGRHVAYCVGRGDAQSSGEFSSTAFASLCVAGLAAVVGIFFAAGSLGFIFRKYPPPCSAPPRQRCAW